MVAAADSEKTKVFSGKKVSKPLMEKKRRARINKCLDQLKTLLETCYSNSIRKRKLEKADILELTVRHLRHLQKNHSGPLMNSDYSEYQAGFRSCLAGVNQYLLKADMGRSNQSDMLTQLSSRLLRPDARDEGSSTADSDPKNGQSTDLTEQRLAANMALQASPVAVSNCVRGIQDCGTLGAVKGSMDQPRKRVPLELCDPTRKILLQVLMCKTRLFALLYFRGKPWGFES
ncbi:hairy-related 3 [Clupea harengus]|uniref:Hairy-related 3 n=1 Tax=Clupea harengus TaxID=7950 RepID=A0A6P3VU86_CLUHA|nr:hairy-related 3 [Clupea harengus]